jgi:phosphatidylglycerol:prolipoprotein diacylglycerol transferase
VIPYIEIPPLKLGEWLTLQPFGLLVTVGVIAGWFVAVREARLRGLDTNVVEGVALWAVAIGFPMASIFDVLFYYPELLQTEPLALFKFWKYMSSYGGFIGGAIGAVGYLKLRRKPVLPYLDCLIVGLAVGWLFGRLGCAVVHDHPGLPTDFILGVQFPDGTRHDLGLYEWMYTILVVAVLFSLPRPRLRPGVVLTLVGVLYAPVRFGLDFLRAADKVYLGLTPAQYASAALGITSLLILFNLLRRGGRPDEALPRHPA